MELFSGDEAIVIDVNGLEGRSYATSCDGTPRGRKRGPGMGPGMKVVSAQRKCAKTQTESNQI